MFTRKYYAQFESEVYACLGGLEPAQEFFHDRISMRTGLLAAARYHAEKGASPATAAACWFQGFAQPELRAGRGLPRFPKLSDILDPRD